ncbi:hypothetical protein IAI10_06190 [Clostridium sp. 19966]|uniref:hypothetical protein n=1 Tax=Clostridium sp. 19966 TaxID=2768166 RepID=UPI0028DDFAF4|nr:hypothetical protein [Clostridium sp. 19966]MDT8716239.1 hypothetical protein [Clostridium sp. 19966]
MRVHKKNTVITVLFITGVILYSMFGNIIPDILNYIVIGLVPLAFIWVFKRYGGLPKKGYKLALSGFSCFALSIYLTIIAGIIESKYPYIYNKYRVTMGIIILIPFVGTATLLTIHRIIYYDNKNNRL